MSACQQNDTLDQVVCQMKLCQQAPNQNVLEHGQSVNRFYHELKAHLVHHHSLVSEWKLPGWINQYRDVILEHLFDDQTMDLYQVYHDCGKPSCRIVDDDERQHFPDHARVSSKVAEQIFPDRPIVHRLILMDMDVHSLKALGVAEFASRPEAVSLLVTGLCEIHANAQMFGGMDCTSFKIKWKQIDLRGRQILARLECNSRCD